MLVLKFINKKLFRPATTVFTIAFVKVGDAQLAFSRLMHQNV